MNIRIIFIFCISLTLYIHYTNASSPKDQPDKSKDLKKELKITIHQCFLDKMLSERIESSSLPTSTPNKAKAISRPASPSITPDYFDLTALTLLAYSSSPKDSATTTQEAPMTPSSFSSTKIIPGVPRIIETMPVEDWIHTILEFNNGKKIKLIETPRTSKCTAKHINNERFFAFLMENAKE